MNEHSTPTAGIDISDRYSKICLVGEVEGEIEVIEETRIRTNREAVKRYFNAREPMVVAMEVGTHSPWMSRLIEELGHEAIVANARKVKFIYENEQKNDDIDAEMLARVARLDAKLLYPIKHRCEVDAVAMALVRSRDALIRARTKLINHVRGAVKSNGKRLPSCATARFHKLEGELPETLASALRPMMDVIKELNERIRELDREIEQKSKESYPETAVLRHVPGVGPITALTFVLVIQNPQRFSRNRSVGPYLGLVPKRDQSGERDPQLSITKSGSPYLRRLLINASHHILGPFGPDTDLRRHGLKIAAGGGKRAKKRAVVAVARKLSILLLALLKTGEVYEPLRQAKQKKTGEAA